MGEGVDALLLPGFMRVTSTWGSVGDVFGVPNASCRLNGETVGVLGVDILYNILFIS